MKYHRAGEPPTIKGRPLLISEFMRVRSGTPGDLIAVDHQVNICSRGCATHPAQRLSFDFQPRDGPVASGLDRHARSCSTDIRTSATSSCSIATLKSA